MARTKSKHKRSTNASKALPGERANPTSTKRKELSSIPIKLRRKPPVIGNSNQNLPELPEKAKKAKKLQTRETIQAETLVLCEK